MEPFSLEEESERRRAEIVNGWDEDVRQKRMRNTTIGFDLPEDSKYFIEFDKHWNKKPYNTKNDKDYPD